MNFLSHYYFHRYTHNPELALGSVLPDFLKNADKGLRLRPERHELKFVNNPKYESLYAGWKHHVAIDSAFHNLPFFYEHTHNLRVRFAPILSESPIRASFLSHIALELLLDHLLLVNDLVDETHFYRDLHAVDRESVHQFLTLSGMSDPGQFFLFLDGFLRENYLGSYRDLRQVAFALLQICRRLWILKPELQLQDKIAEVLTDYKTILMPEYKNVFGNL